MLDIRPFNEFWIDCKFNTCFSIITSINKSYIDAAYMNCYSYIAETAKTPFTEVKCLRLENSDERQSELIKNNIKLTPVAFRKQENMIERVIELLENNYLLVGVDLYYLVHGSVCWNRYHWEHYSFVKKYDKDRNAFIVLDDDLNGFGEHEVPGQRFKTAVLNSTLPEDGFIVKHSNYMEDYIINNDEVFFNADRLVKELKELAGLPVAYWALSDHDIKEGYMFDLFALYAFQIANRQTANIKLMGRLKDLKFIDEEKYNAMTCMFEEIKNGWTLIKNRFIKGNISVPRKLDIASLNTIKDSMIAKEINAWGKFTCKGLEKIS